MGNGDGQIHSITETNGSNSTVYLYRYDSLGNLVGSEKLTNNSLVLRTHHSYDTDNRLSAQGWQIGSDSFSQTYNYGEWDGNLSSIVLSRNSSNITVNYTYDGLRRLASMNNGVFTRTYNYETAESGDATPRLSSFTHSGIQSQYTYEWDYSYGYDINGNITSATFGNRTNTYVYDANNQLIRENNDRLQYTQTWEYDAFGNITATRKYDYTTGELGTPSSTVNYGYTDSNWGDLLTAYKGQTITYDGIGNPLTVTDSEGNVVESFTWTQGRQLASHTTNGVTWSYTYDADGLRTGRTDGTNTYQYIYAGDKLVRMIYNGEVVDISYAGSQPLSLTYDRATYYYVLNGQGDVIGLTNSSGKMVIGYTFGAYGVATGLVADPELSYVLVQMNPLTYRGYVYDRETKFYYLQSRYYDPELGRFINADAYASTGQGILGNNMFAYCLNNPIMYCDLTGKKVVAVGFQLDIQADDVCTGIEIVIYFDDEICNGEEYSMVAYTYSGASVSGNELLGLTSTLEKETTMIITELGSQDQDLILFALKALLEDCGLSGAVFIIDANSEFTKFEDYSGPFDTVTATVTYKGIDYSVFKSSSETCDTYGIKVGYTPGPKKWYIPFDISYSRTYYSEPIVIKG